MGQVASDIEATRCPFRREPPRCERGQPDVELCPAQFIGHAVVVIVDIDMIIDVDDGDVRLGVFVGFCTGRSVGLIEGVENDFRRDCLSLRRFRLLETLQRIANGFLRSARV